MKNFNLDGEKVDMSINGGSFLYIYKGKNTKVLGCDGPDCAKFFLMPKEDQEAKVQIPNRKILNSNKISEKWFGTYSFTVNAKSKDWKDIQNITLTISKDSIFFHTEGYQIDQNYKLSATEINNTLKLQYESAIDNNESAILDKTKDFGKLVYNQNKY